MCPSVTSVTRWCTATAPSPAWCRCDARRRPGLMSFLDSGLKEIAMTSVLIVVSPADRWPLNDGPPPPSGYWAEELAEPHRIFAAAGWDITIATPGGVAPTGDRLSLGLLGGLPAKTRGGGDYLRQNDSALGHPK